MAAGDKLEVVSSKIIHLVYVVSGKAACCIYTWIDFGSQKWFVLAQGSLEGMWLSFVYWYGSILSVRLVHRPLSSMCSFCVPKQAVRGSFPGRVDSSQHVMLLSPFQVSGEGGEWVCCQCEHHDSLAVRLGGLLCG